MRHYLWYKTNGAVGGHHSFGHADPAIGAGFPDDIDPTDPNTTHPTALLIANAHQHPKTGRHYPDFAGLLAYDCGCDGKVEVGGCGCSGMRSADSIVKGGKLVKLPPITLLVNGAAVGPDNSIDNPMPMKAGTTFNLVVQGDPSWIKDGTTIKFAVTGGGGGQGRTLASVTFTNGVSTPAVFSAPNLNVLPTYWIVTPNLFVPFAAVFLKGVA